MKHKILFLSAALIFTAAGCNKSTTQSTPPPAPPVVVTPPATNPPPVVLPTTPTPTTPSPSPKPSPVIPPVPIPQPQPPQPTAPPPASPEKSFSITANDQQATPSMVVANKGDKVNLTITLGTTNVYQFGLEFRGGSINSGTIMPGASKTFSFTANSTITLNAYWPSSGVQKTASIMVHVVE
jgi:outer membrane biosynthesis protein TonB